jgi:hypothetical protein
LLARVHGLVNYEAPAPVVFAGLLREAPGLFLDIGANTGIFTLLAAASDELCRFSHLNRSSLRGSCCTPTLPVAPSWRRGSW